jgi:hypothetical protein
MVVMSVRKYLNLHRRFTPLIAKVLESSPNVDHPTKISNLVANLVKVNMVKYLWLNTYIPASFVQ